MSPFSLQFVLLVAVAASQIFGGISCCCLGKAIFPPVAYAANGSQPATQPVQRARCPKCAARTSHQSPASLSKPVKQLSDPAKVCENIQCRCIKAVNSASTPNDPSVHQPTVYGLVGTIPAPLLTSADRTPAARKFKVPDRLGGRSWQSIACVWKN